ncbi:NlpC/P60 family protein [Actinoplanes sp. NPDC048967]|uniref:C40 family peptidase n=1 Tax=Actinoplanes sp. NPDC048967 TaxID=3155269 RepID=UPI0033D3D296
MAYSAATAAAIAALFNPLPASAAPPAAPPAPAVPDAGSRPLAQGSLVLPGQQVPTTPTTTAPITTPGVAMTPVMQKIEKGRTELAALGERLTKAKDEVDLTTQQAAAADQKVTQSSAAVSQARSEVANAAAAAVRDAAALPPGSIGSGLSDLDSLARINRGDSATQQAASRQLTIAETIYNAALTEQQAAQTRLTTFTADRDKLQKDVDKKSAAQQKLEQDNAAAIAAADSAQAAQDAQAGAGYLAGENAGRGADPRAMAALRFALAQRGDPYVWSEEGPDEYDCSGLMWAAYRSPGAGDFKLTRVSRDQYFQTRERVVDRYSLLPGDLLFFSSSSSWQQIHHVAMYAGNGMMVEAPRTGLNVRLVPVRWTRLFGATRIYGSIEGTVQGPNLGSPDPEKPSDHNPKPTTKPTTKPPATKPTTPSTKPTTPSTKPTTPSTKPTTPSTKPTTPAATPTTEKPATTPPTTAAPVTTTPSEDKPSTPEGSAENSPTKADSPAATKSTSASASTGEASKSSGS